MLPMTRALPNPVLKEVLGDDIPVLSLMPPCYSVIKKMDAYVYFFLSSDPFTAAVGLCPV